MEHFYRVDHAAGPLARFLCDTHVIHADEYRRMTAMKEEFCVERSSNSSSSSDAEQFCEAATERLGQVICTGTVLC